MQDTPENRRRVIDASCDPAVIERVITRMTRVSIPTQLRRAGHTVEVVTTDLGAIDYRIDGGEPMTLAEAADRYLPGGWAESFGRTS